MNFQLVLAEAQKKAVELESRSQQTRQAMKQEFRSELANCKNSDLAPAIKKPARKLGESYLDPFCSEIIAQRKSGKKFREITVFLAKQGVDTSPVYVAYYYNKKTGGCEKSDRRHGVSQLDGYEDFLVQALKQNKSYPTIASELKQQGIDLHSVSVGLFIKRKGLDKKAKELSA